MNVDIGTGGSQTKIIIVSTPVTLGVANISGWLMADRLADFSSANSAQGGVIGVTGFSTVVSGTVMIYAHD